MAQDPKLGTVIRTKTGSEPTDFFEAGRLTSVSAPSSECLHVRFDRCIMQSVLLRSELRSEVGVCFGRLC